MSQKTPDTDFKVVFGMMAALVIPAVITLLTIRQASPPIFGPETPDPSPLGLHLEPDAFHHPGPGVEGVVFASPPVSRRKESIG